MEEMEETVDQLTPSQRNAITRIGIDLGVLIDITSFGEPDECALFLLPNLDSLVWLDAYGFAWHEFNDVWVYVKHRMQNSINVSRKE